LNINFSNLFTDNENDLINFSILPGTQGNASVNGNTISYSAINGISSDTIRISYCDDYCFPLCDTFSIILSITSTATRFSLNLPPIIDACDGEIITLDAGILNATYNWSTGDTTQQITVTSGGTYILNVNQNGCSGADTSIVTFHSQPILSLNDTSSCQSINLNISDTTLNITWNGSQVGNLFTVDTTSTITIEAENNFGCISYDTVNVIINSPPIPDIGNDTSFCNGVPFSITLFANGFTSVLWSDNSSDDSLVVTSLGNYSVTVTDLNGCIGYDTVSVNIQNGPAVNLGPDTESCSFDLSSNVQGNSYLWSTGQTTSSIHIDSTDTYWLQVTDASGCTGSDTVLISIIQSNGFFGFIPNVFSPNGDGINDEFRISGISDFCSDELHVEIYNRWGQLLFISDDPSFIWNGKFKNETVPDGVYYILFKGSFGGKDISGNHTVSVFR